MIKIDNTANHTVSRPPYCMLTVVAIFLTLTACAIDHPPSAPGPAFKPHNASLFTRLVDPTGCAIEQITTADHDEYTALQSVSADGKMLSMAARQKVAGESAPIVKAYEMDLATGAKTDLSHVLQNAGAYSPDGRFIVVAQPADNDSDKTDIFEYERATGGLRPVAAHQQWDWLPSYSPDGRFIVFNSYRVAGQSDIHLFEKSTAILQRLTEDPGYEAHGQFSPDGKRILFHRQRGTRADGGYIFDLLVHDLETGLETRLTDGDYEESYAAWAPDGRHIVYSSDKDGKPKKSNLYMWDTGGTTTARLTQGDWQDSYAFWSRDGNFIYFNSDRSGATNIFRMPMNGTACVRGST